MSILDHHAPLKKKTLKDNNPPYISAMTKQARRRHFKSAGGKGVI